MICAEIDRRLNAPSAADQIALFRLFECLGILGRRGVDEATLALRSMSSDAYWNERNVRLNPNAVGKSVLTDIDILKSFAVSGYALNERDDVDEVVAAMLMEMPESDRKASLARGTSRSHITSARKERRRFEQEPVQHQPELEQSIRDLWNGNLQNPQPSGQGRMFSPSGC